MMYSKGDTFITYDGTSALVLDKGLTGMEFHCQFVGKEIYIFRDNRIFYFTRFRYIYIADKNSIIISNIVWYHVLVGDKKGWYGVQ